ncbi:MAG: sensor histidine kinase [Sphingobacteriaceae bacterium]
MALVGFLNVSLGAVVFVIFNLYEFLPESIAVLVIAALVPVFNKYKNYIWAAYTFYIIGWLFFTILGLKMGLDSFVFLLFFPVILSLLQLLTRRELIKHLVINFVICFAFMLLLLFGSKHQWLYLSPDSETVNVLKYMNVFFSLTVTLSFLTVLSIEGMRQERLINSMLKEKEVLLAEVFHRVKNNMNIVTSLLNLKKNASESEVVKQALEECKNRVYSMALVHQNIYKTNNFTELDMKEYIHDLVDELLDSHGNTLDTETVVKCTDISLDLARAVPFGLILNELITNSFKYARTSDKKLRIEIHVVKEQQNVSLLYRDNGPGMNDALPKKNALGVELIRSLSEQVDGAYGFENKDGLLFKLNFRSN